MLGDRIFAGGYVTSSGCFLFVTSDALNLVWAWLIYFRFRLSVFTSSTGVILPKLSAVKFFLF